MILLIFKDSHTESLTYCGKLLSHLFPALFTELCQNKEIMYHLLHTSAGHLHKSTADNKSGV